METLRAFFALILISFPPGCLATCLSDGQLAGIIFGSIFGTLVIAGIVGAALMWKLKKRKEAEQKVFRPNPVGLESQGKTTDPASRFVYDNPEFREEDDQPVDRKNKQVRSSEMSDQSSERSSDVQAGLQYPPKGVQFSPKGRYRSAYTTESLNSLDEFVVVPLKSQDFTGLGFSVVGNLKEGIYVKEVYGRGPAMDSGKIHPGDRLIGVTVSFRQMAFEDALTILSYASPYDVNLELQKVTIPPKAKLSRMVEINRDSSRQIQFHPLVKSQSMEKLSAAGGPQRTESETRRSRNMAVPGDIVDLGGKRKATDSPATLSKTRVKLEKKAESPQLSIGRQTEQPQVYRKFDPDQMVLRTGSADKVVTQAEVTIEAVPTEELSFEEVTTEVTFEKPTEKQNILKSVDLQSSAKAAHTAAILRCQVDEKLVEWNSSRRQSDVGTGEFVDIDISDPYGHLSDEDKNQVLRLSYEESGLYEFDSSELMPVEIPELHLNEEIVSTPLYNVFETTAEVVEVDIPEKVDVDHRISPPSSEDELPLAPIGATIRQNGDSDSLEGEEFDFSGTLKRLKGANHLLDYDPDKPPTDEPPSPPSVNIEPLIYDQPLPDNLVELAEIKVESALAEEVPIDLDSSIKEFRDETITKVPPGPDSGIDFEPWEAGVAVPNVTESPQIDQMRLERERMFISGNQAWDRARESEEKEKFIASNEDLYTVSTMEIREVVVEKFGPELKRNRKIQEAKPTDPEYIRLRHPDLSTSPTKGENDFSKLYLERKAKLKEAAEKSNWLRPFSPDGSEAEAPPAESYSSRVAISLSPGSTVSHDSSDSSRVGLTNGLVRARKVVIDSSLDSSDVANNNSTQLGKRDSGYGTLGPTEKALEARLDQQHYQKLLYFQQQLARQHEELAQLGIQIPPPPNVVHSELPKSQPPPIPESESSV